MIVVQKAESSNGVLLQGDFFDFDRLYFAVMKFTGFHGLDDDCNFPDSYDFCETVLGLCYEMRHAWQGDRDLVQMYNGINREWFDDSSSHSARSDYESIDSGIVEETDGIDDDFFIFSRKDFPYVTESNAYFSTNITFLEAIFYALALSDLIRHKDLFIASRRRIIKEDESMKELNKEYLLFQAEQDVARILIFINQTLHALYRFIGEENYQCFISKYEEEKSFTHNCNLGHIMQVISDYGEKEYAQDDPKTLTSALLSFFNK